MRTINILDETGHSTLLSGEGAEAKLATMKDTANVKVVSEDEARARFNATVGAQTHWGMRLEKVPGQDAPKATPIKSFEEQGADTLIMPKLHGG